LRVSRLLAVVIAVVRNRRLKERVSRLPLAISSLISLWLRRVRPLLGRVRSLLSLRLLSISALLRLPLRMRVVRTVALTVMPNRLGTVPVHSIRVIIPVRVGQ
jgi:hypothetical protein